MIFVKKLYRCKKCGSTSIEFEKDSKIRICNNCGSRYDEQAVYIDNPSQAIIDAVMIKIAQSRTERDSLVDLERTPS